MTDDPPPQYPDQNPASGWPPPAQPGPADEREQSSTPSDQTWYSTEPPTTIAPVPPTAPPQAYPASPAYGQATPASPAYGQATPAYPPSPAAYPGSPADPYTVPADPYPTTPYPPAPAPAGYPYGQTSAPPYGQPSGPPYGQVMQPAMAVVIAPASGAALASMILGIVGLVFGCFLCGIPSVLAIIFGHIGLNQTKNDVKSGRGQAIAGLVMGYVLIIPTIIGTIFVLGYLGVFGATLASTSTGG